MAPTAASYLTVDDYDRLYGGENGWEYWFGEARRKPAPTFLHGLLAGLLFELLRRSGYFVSSESDLKTVPDWRPRPDVYGVLEPIPGDYATRPVDVVFEIISAADDPETKCRQYSRIGVPQVFAFDPEAQAIFAWDGSFLLSLVDVELQNGITITGRTIWSEMETRSKERLEPPSSGVI